MLSHKYMNTNGMDTRQQEAYLNEEDEHAASGYGNGGSGDDGAGGEANESHNGGVERLPVSIAELNIKPYKCLKCGFRSDRKSDTLRHIRVKHDVDTNHAFKFLRIMSIKDASETIDEYESTRLFRKSTPRVVSRDYALINSLVQQSGSNSSVAKSSGGGAIGGSQVSSPARASPMSSAPVSLTKPAIAPISSVIKTVSLNNNNNNSTNGGLKLPSMAAIKTTTVKTEPLTSLDYFRCPICMFKHRSRLVMKKHLSNHYHVNDIKQNAVYGCNICSFKAAWQFTVKKHILSMHVANPHAYVVKLNQLAANKPCHANKQKKKLKVRASLI